MALVALDKILAWTRKHDLDPITNDEMNLIESVAKAENDQSAVAKALGRVYGQVDAFESSDVRDGMRSLLRLPDSRAAFDALTPAKKLTTLFPTYAPGKKLVDLPPGKGFEILGSFMPESLSRTDQEKYAKALRAMLHENPGTLWPRGIRFMIIRNEDRDFAYAIDLAFENGAKVRNVYDREFNRLG